MKQAPGAPELPPRAVSPPPLPPRTSTLPRMQSSSSLQRSCPTHHHHMIPHRQPIYHLDPPPQRRRNNSMDLSTPSPLTRRHTTNGPQPSKLSSHKISKISYSECGLRIYKTSNLKESFN